MFKRSVLTAVLFLFAISGSLFAQGNARRVVNDGDRVTLKGNVPAQAAPQDDQGPADVSFPMQHMVLVLSPRPGTQKKLEKLLADLHDPNSPNYQHWLTPEQYAAQFGISDQDLADVTDWLQRHGFTIDEVARGRGSVTFSGNVSQVEEAFQTQIHTFLVHGKMHHANTEAPSIPRGLADIVQGVVSLHDFRHKPMHVDAQQVSPDYTSGSSHYLSPADFAAIYNVNPLYNASINGSGQSIAVVGRTDINLADVQYFRSLMGLPGNNPQFIHNGTDPGDLGGGEETEADLDVEWAGAVAKNATVKFVISKSTTTDGVDLSAQYIVNNNLAPVMTTSFGSCEQQMGSSELSFWNNLWSQAAAEGITAFVSSGDSGAAGCESGSAATGTQRAVNGLCSSPYSVCVGGTQFNDTSSPSTYWASANSAGEKSALAYIPEITWNQSGSVSGGSGLWATGGGASTTFAKPSWQSVSGVPADAKRDVPDVSLSAATHDAYLIVQGHTSTASGLKAVGGTSAASPSFASIMALVLQHTGARAGNANTKFYPLAKSQYAGTGAKIFHDVSAGNNTVPGVTGYSSGSAYDLTTGLGSVDANALVTNWNQAATPAFTLSVSPTSKSIVRGSSSTATVTTSVSGGFNSVIALSASGAPTGVTVSLSPSSIVAPGSGSSTMTIAVASTAATGTYTITVTAVGAGITHASKLTLTVTAPSTVTQLLGNPGFENGSASPAPWVPSAGVIDSSTYEAAHSGLWKAWLDGYGTTHTDTLYQQVTIPSTATSAALSFYLHIDTNETTTTSAYDKLTLQLRDTSNNVLGTLGTWSNLNAASGYLLKSFSLLTWKGKTVRIYFTGSEDASLQTSFVIDDTALKVQ